MNLPQDYVITALIFLIGSIIQGVIGFGFNILGVPFLTILAGPRTAVTVVSIPSFIISLIPVVQRLVHKTGTVRFQPGLVLPLFIFGSLGTLAGTSLLVFLDPTTLLTWIGIIVIVFVCTDHIRKKWHPQPRAVTPLGIAMGSITGILNGLAGLTGPLLVPYLHTLKLDKESFVYYLNISFVFFGALRWISFYSLGLFTVERVLIGASLIPISIIGMKLGERARQHVSADLFSKIVLVVLFITGLDLIRRGLHLF